MKKTKRHRTKFFQLILFFTFIMLIPCITQAQSSEEVETVTPSISSLYNPEQLKQIDYTYRVFEINKGHWGFEIKGNKVSIVQQNYRQVTDQSGLISTGQEAAQVAQLRINKLRKGDASPLTKADLVKIYSTEKGN